MINLLKANLDRLMKSKLFIIFVIFTVCLAFTLVFNNYRALEKYNDSDRNVQQLILNYSLISRVCNIYFYKFIFRF